ncbi:MAG: AraC family transcriptional regulator [Alphaproteobacteria bacterium]|nr:AraC family transcriptional regulator [Alphaproteobacteria bacterium]MBU1514353.1 AraC family transcriptional regulator [Alphaproteobacteria bacterium]MBU2095997.1 AraC family transcriptional regulator [Alphaproteobacteria bacterium]MBU2153095.1 AraC family transcriptional regulator [Alphaproteobacteria bacterium]MBU2308552.1 AraC family transcriptional regulator [Alphaproteobacteria bacterium]
MTYPFKFTNIEQPSLELGRLREWGGMAARQVRATPGKHNGGTAPEHRLIFYLTPDVQTECASEGLRQRRISAPYDFDLVPAGASGFWEDYTACDMVAVRLNRSLLASTAEALALPGGRAELTPRLGARDPLVEHVLRALAAELEAPAPAGRIYADSLAVALSTRLLQNFAALGAGGVGGRQTLSKPQVRRVVEFVEANLDGELTLEQVAEVAGMSIPHLTTLFRRTMGQSVHAYVMERRVQRARTLLLGRRMTIAEVALETGFAHQSHLARWMRRLLGVTPSEILRA